MKNYRIHNLQIKGGKRVIISGRVAMKGASEEQCFQKPFQEGRGLAQLHWELILNSCCHSMKTLLLVDGFLSSFGMATWRSIAWGNLVV